MSDNDSNEPTTTTDGTTTQHGSDGCERTLRIEIEDPFPMEIVGAEALIGTERPADGQECTHYYRGIGEVCTNDAAVVWVIGNPDLPAEEREPTRHPVCSEHHKLPDEALPDGVESGGDPA